MISPPSEPGRCTMCNYFATCSHHAALHMLLEHADGDVVITRADYSPECMRCFYSDLEPYVLVTNSTGCFIQAARIGATLMVLPQCGKDSADHGDTQHSKQQRG